MSFFLLDHNWNFLFRLPPYLLKVEATKKMPLGCLWLVNKLCIHLIFSQQLTVGHCSSYMKSLHISLIFASAPKDIWTFVKKKWSSVTFLAGLPLAYYSSFPLFALTHLIVIVIWCAVLGDDVVIADELLAKVYEKALENVNLSYPNQSP